MPSRAHELRARAERFSVRMIEFVQQVRLNPPLDVVTRQLVRSSTAIGSNYRAAGRARSRAEFIAKLGVVVEEADETEYWLDLLERAPIAKGETFHQLRQEAGELRAIFVAAAATARRRQRSSGRFKRE